MCTEKIIEFNAVTEKQGKFTYVWSTGGTTAKISLLDPGTYTVTVTDLCGNTASASRDLKKIDFNIDKLISDLKLNTSIDSNCKGVSVNITFEPDNNLSLLKSFKWSTGETGRGIIFTGKKTYSVTVTDICDTQYAASGDLDVPNVLNYAHVFFPGGIGSTLGSGGGTGGATKQDTLDFQALALNRSFGPINKDEYCLDEVTNYQFHVFNRWGQEVFKSTDWKVEWPGKTDGGTDWPSDTYVWVVKYSILGFPQKNKGDVTLIR
ncbi:MAG: gliding motility-associated C-terminal domain-containing protein [Saprospiraceae bacterium]|nr:gliding motility-associated C-terminal domain-containing protein [Saprospiraceae bacterium]